MRNSVFANADDLTVSNSRRHGLVEVKLPKKVLRDSRISPLPLRELQDASFDPFLAPLPPQDSHTLIFAIRTRRSVPNIASRKGNSISMDISRPRGFPPLAGLPPAKKSLNISPRSNSWKLP